MIQLISKTKAIYPPLKLGNHPPLSWPHTERWLLLAAAIPDVRGSVNRKKDYPNSTSLDHPAALPASTISTTQRFNPSRARRSTEQKTPIRNGFVFFPAEWVALSAVSVSVRSRSCGMPRGYCFQLCGERLVNGELKRKVRAEWGEPLYVIATNFPNGSISAQGGWCWVTRVSPMGGGMVSEGSFGTLHTLGAAVSLRCQPTTMTHPCTPIGGP